MVHSTTALAITGGPTVLVRVFWFAGSADMSVNDSPSLDDSTQLTVAFWVEAYPNSDLQPRIIAKVNDWDIQLNGANRNPRFDSGSQYATLNYSLPLRAFHHIAFTYSNGTVTGYVDGVAVAFLNNTFSGSGSLPGSTNGLYVGTDSSKTYEFIGALKDFRIYEGALTAAQIAALYAAKD
jgi:hypothetical protein